MSLISRNSRDRDQRSGHLEHDSSRGKTVRNAGDFTRGSQLIRAQWLQAIDGVKIPLFTWLGLFTVIHIVGLYLIMGTHEIQLCVWRLIATLWGWMDLSPDKPVNILLPSDATESVGMGEICALPEVASAWHRMWMSVAIAMLIATVMSFLATAWFVEASKRRSRDMLTDKHERGALLVSRKVLLADVLAYNEAKLSEWIARTLPGHTLKSVLALPFAQRQALGVHHPYYLADVPYPYGLEQSHTIVIGTTGAGKTTQLRSLVSQMRERGDSAVIFDLTGAYVEAFYDPTTDTILNPLDARCPAWSVFDDCSTESEFTAAAPALVPSDGGAADPFWALAARTLFVEMCMALQREGKRTNADLATYLMTCSLEVVHQRLRDTIADPITAPEAAKMAESVRATFNTNARALLALPDEGSHYSISGWVREEKKPGSILFITSRHVDLDLTKALVTLWVNIAINTVMTLPKTQRLRTWFMFDELGALHKLPAISSGMQTARSAGGAFVLGLHSFARLKEVYGQEGAENLISLARSKLILTTSDYDSAEACAKAIGNREVRQMDEAYSYGHNSLRDASTLTPQKKIEPLVLPDDIQRLPSLHGYVVYPEGMATARIKLTPKTYPEVAEGFIQSTRDHEERARLVRERKRDDGGPSPANEPTKVDRPIEETVRGSAEAEVNERSVESDLTSLPSIGEGEAGGEEAVANRSAADPLKAGQVEQTTTAASSLKPRTEAGTASRHLAGFGSTNQDPSESPLKNVAVRNELMIDQADQGRDNDQKLRAPQPRPDVIPQHGAGDELSRALVSSAESQAYQENGYER